MIKFIVIQIKTSFRFTKWQALFKSDAINKENENIRFCLSTPIQIK